MKKKLINEKNPDLLREGPDLLKKGSGLNEKVPELNTLANGEIFNKNKKLNI